MLFFITGANGSGKSASLHGLREHRPDIAWYDFDDVGVPPDAGTFWRQESTQYWVDKALENQAQGLDTGICGHAILGEVLATPHSVDVQGISLCLLDCGDVVRVDRLRTRGTHGADQDTLNWAAWQRMHASDPQWRPDIILDNSHPAMQWSRWTRWRRGDTRWHVDVIDTTHLTIAQVVSEISKWVFHETGRFVRQRHHLGGIWWTER